MELEKIDTNLIRGHWQNYEADGLSTGGDDTIKSIQTVANRVNEIIDVVNKLEKARQIEEDKAIRMVQV